jgi:hypothetical protein
MPGPTRAKNRGFQAAFPHPADGCRISGSPVPVIAQSLDYIARSFGYVARSLDGAITSLDRAITSLDHPIARSRDRSV